MTAAMIGALLLLFGSLKVCLYFAERIVKRHQNYEGLVGLARVAAAGPTAIRLPPPLPAFGPQYPPEPENKLNIFEGDD